MTESRRYRILEVVGRGSFGVVYRAELLGTGGFARPVALKILRTGLHPQPEIELRLRDEARILGLLRHPAVVQVHGLARLPEGWAVVMEYIAGVDAAALVLDGPLPPRVAAEIGRDVAGALHAAWSMPSEVTGKPLRLVHRDLKPSNVRITEHGEVKILDFGAARADFAEREAQTQAWRFGTPRYMAPERHDGVEGPAGDIYALGLVLAQLLLGEKTPDPPTNPDRHHAFVSGVWEALATRLEASLSERDQDQARALVGLVREMLDYNPDFRPDARGVTLRLRALADALPGPGLRAWAEQRVPTLLHATPTLTGDPRCGAVLEENQGDDTTLASSVMAEVVAAPTPTPTATRPAAVRWREAGAGVALGLALLVSLLLVLRPWSERPAETPAPSPAPPPEIVLQPVASFPVESLAPPEEPPAAEVSPPPASPVVLGSPPVKAAPAAEERPRIAPPPEAPPEPATGTVQVSGVVEAWLIGDAGRVAPGAVPAGQWSVEVVFEGRSEPVPAGKITLHPGETVRMSCLAAMLRCKKEVL